MLYLVQREDCQSLTICADLDPLYARTFAHAIAAGVEAYAVKCKVTPTEIVPLGPIAMDEPGLAALCTTNTALSTIESG